MKKDYSIAPLGDRSVIVEWAQQIDPVVHRRVMQAFHTLQSMQRPYILDLIPAYASLTIVYDAAQMRRHHPLSPAEVIRTVVTEVLERDVEQVTAAPRQLEIPVCYDISLAPDITAMAEEKQMTVEGIIALHTAGIYTVYMIGFLPGFPYMGKVDDRLATPRLKQPRLKVPAGSVGIAGAQTGIYPMESPGGWNIIGRTPLRMFDPAREQPCYCQPGDAIRFAPISLATFRDMSRQQI